MAVAERIYPETMVSPETGETLHRDVRPFVVTHRGKSIGRAAEELRQPAR
ncbi:hypothetical protein [Rhizobium ruizarguesonis]|nr:hypothetical protein [Rhizobium ruizarguesonis]